MKRVFITLVCLNICVCLYAQGITLLYKNDMGWNDPQSWVQINTPVGQTPIQRVPTELDDVIISKSLSGLPAVGFLSDVVNTDFFIGSNNTSGYRCKSMHISNTTVSFDSPNDIDAAAQVHIYTSNGGFALIDSASDITRGQFYLNGGNHAITDLEIINSNFGVLFSHGDWCDILMQPAAKLRVTGSTLGGHMFGAESTGGEMYARNCTFSTNNFKMGDNSTDTLLNTTITNDLNNVSFNFFIGRNANFVSANVSVEPVEGFAFTSSGSVLNGQVTTTSGYAGGGSSFLQEDPANPLPNIINGDVYVGEVNTLGISGDLKISGNLAGFTDDYYNNPAHVFVNAQYAFNAAGITNYQGKLSINNCTEDFCHYKLEFFGSTDSRITWNAGFPIDTFIINKAGCAKVTFDSSLYVSGATRIEGGQLVLDPNANHPYKFVCAGNVDIAQGGGLFLRKDAAGIVANMAVAGTITDHNATADSSCAGLSNPYKGKIASYKALLPIPGIISFAPSAGSLGSKVTIKGKNFTAANLVTFGGIPAESFVVNNDSTINAVVGPGSTGSVFVQTEGGYDSLPQFTYSCDSIYNPAPSISSIGDSVLFSTMANFYQWFFNNTKLGNANSDSLHANKSGFYTVETSPNNLCWASSPDYPVLVSVGPLADTLTMRMYPNPSSGQFTVDVKLPRRTTVIAYVMVYEVNGNEVLQTSKLIFFGDEIKIPVTINAKGTFFVKAFVNGSSIRQPIVIL